jgi:hypothetical protein
VSSRCCAGRSEARVGRFSTTDPPLPTPAVRLPGLLAMEARIEGVNTWPFDISTFLRFSALGLLAVGSWLGGAVIERLLGLAVD